MGFSKRAHSSIQVVGNMGAALEEADATIKNTLLKCMRQPATTLSVQLAAIQAFRRMSVTDEVDNTTTPIGRIYQIPFCCVTFPEMR